LQRLKLRNNEGTVDGIDIQLYVNNAWGCGFDLAEGTSNNDDDLP